MELGNLDLEVKYAVSAVLSQHILRKKWCFLFAMIADHDRDSSYSQTYIHLTKHKT